MEVTGIVGATEKLNGGTHLRVGTKRIEDGAEVWNWRQVVVPAGVSCAARIGESVSVTGTANHRGVCTADTVEVAG